MGAHYNPFATNHGPYYADDEHRHVGDIMSLEVLGDHTAEYNHTDFIASLFGSNSIAGRGFVITSQADDNGAFDDGNSGYVIACGTIILNDGSAADSDFIDD